MTAGRKWLRHLKFGSRVSASWYLYLSLVLTHFEVTTVFHWLKMGKSQSKNQSQLFSQWAARLPPKALPSKIKRYKLRDHLNDIPRREFLLRSHPYAHWIWVYPSQIPKKPRNESLNSHSQPKDRYPLPPVCTPHTDAPPCDNAWGLTGSLLKSRAGLAVLVHCGILIWIPKKKNSILTRLYRSYPALELGSDVRSTRRCLPEYSHCLLIVPFLARGLPVMSRHRQGPRSGQLSLYAWTGAQRVL